MTAAAPDDQRGPNVRQYITGLGLVQRVVLFSVFASVYLLAVLAGLSLRENTENLTIIWPAAGLLFMALLMTPHRFWISVVAVQVAVELSVSAFHSDHFTILEYAPYALANSLDGIVSASIAGRIMVDPQIPSIKNVLRFIVAVAIGAAASAVVGAFAATHTLGGAHYLRDWQLWWAGNWLGSLCIAPVLMGWIIRFRAREFSAPPAPAVELMLIGGALLAMTIWVFSAPPSRITSILDMPFSILALIVVAAFRFPPRWSALLAASVALLASYYASRNLGPFAGDPSAFVRVGAAQLNISAIVVINFMLTIVLLEMRNAFSQLRTSEERYRQFHRTEFRGRVARRTGRADGSWLGHRRSNCLAASARARRGKQPELSEVESTARPARRRCAPVARRRAVVRAFHRTSGRCVAPRLLDGRPAIQRLLRFPSDHLHHRIPRRHRGTANWCGFGAWRATSRNSLNSATVCASSRIDCGNTRASWSARKSAPGARRRSTCTMALASSWWDWR